MTHNLNVRTFGGKMDYTKTFQEIAKECKDSRTYIIIGLLQSIRDNCLPDATIKEEMLKMCYIPKKCCLLNYTQDSTKVDTK